MKHCMGAMWKVRDTARSGAGGATGKACMSGDDAVARGVVVLHVTHFGKMPPK